ncbi:hypothetical protein Pme01_51740 [Planosporangium mesophilum]|uniref:Uncharacterized protein n=1 Tax=Planosporangium mesophilum TaxID=689768 RepID=A0A8J3TGY9_9ACTN|nr:hypothetical protein Pme01_51740 [Planosporangium mesophilum]
MMDEKGTWFDVVVVTNAIDRDADPGHQASPLSGFGARRTEPGSAEFDIADCGVPNSVIKA